jgi:DNA recombination protein RmuC
MLVAVGLVLLFALAGLALWLRTALQRLGPRPEDQMALADVRGQLTSMTQQVAHLQGQVTQSLGETRKAMDVRLDGTANVIKDVSRQLGQLSEKTQRLADIGKDIASLQDILRSPKLRGNMGELFLGDLLAQILPPEHYQLQYPFKDGGKVDAVIRLQAGLVPVDAKFPLENFQRLVRAETPEEKKALRRAFLQDVKKHIEAIAGKYIRTDEGTFDFALMYIPAENVYYEVIIKDDELGADGALFDFALTRRVIPVSPNSFYAYLQTILLGLKGMRVEESAREIINHLARLNLEFDRFSESFRLVGDHMENALKKYEEAQKRLLKVEGKMDQLDGLAKGELAPPAPGPIVTTGL